MKSKKLLKLFGAIGLVVVLIALLMAGCAKPAPAPAPAPAPTKIFHWVANHHAMPTTNEGKNFLESMRSIEKASNGRIFIDIHWGSELGKMDAMLDAVGSGAVDVAHFIPSHHEKAMPLWGVGHMPFTCASRADLNVLALNEAGELPLLKQEFDNVNLKMLGATAYAAFNLYTNKPVRTVDDLKGLKLRAQGEQADTLERAGATIVWTPFMETYTALDTGLIDGSCCSWPTILNMRFNDVVTYATRGINIGITPDINVVNMDRWNELPDDIKAAIEDEQLTIYQAKVCQYYWDNNEIRDKTFADWEKEGMEFIQLPPEEKAKLVAIANDVNKQWQQEWGEPAEKVYEQYTGIVKQLEEKYPEGLQPEYKP